MNVIFPWGKSCGDALMQPRSKVLQCEQRHLRGENQYTGRITREATAFQRWHYSMSWDYLSAAEANYLELKINQLKGGEGVAVLPVYAAFKQPNIQFAITGNVGAQVCAFTGGTELQEGMYFTAGSNLHYITFINGNELTVKPLLRASHTATAASTYMPTGRFWMPDDNASVRRQGADATADLTFMEFF